MGKQSKNRKRALNRAYEALRQIKDFSGVYFNNSQFVKITNLANVGLPKNTLTDSQ